MSQVYDVCVVGVGPSGATCAYDLARRGKRVLLLERKEFPRDKLCGDAVCSRAQVMTGAQPKRHFLRPRLALPLALEVGREWWRRRRPGGTRAAAL